MHNTFPSRPGGTEAVDNIGGKKGKSLETVLCYTGFQLSKAEWDNEELTQYKALRSSLICRIQVVCIN